ncbi:uncharacterized protein [Henckelia pumila]|uniref:uncharacterized protein n=1 Tax=Henckelia pumila TaxID=405737 RepID=UPI003C6E9D75
MNFRVRNQDHELGVERGAGCCFSEVYFSLLNLPAADHLLLEEFCQLIQGDHFIEVYQLAPSVENFKLRRRYGRKRKSKRRGGGNVADMTVDQLNQFIIRTVQTAMGQNPPPPPPPPLGGQSNQMDAVWEEIRRLGRQPTLGEYDGSSDPEEHLGRFENAALLHRYSDAIKCRVSLTTLVRSAQQWFNLLQPGSIRSFNDLSSAFLHQFASRKKYLKTSLSLFNLKQSEVEPLREYVQRFNTEALEVPAATADTLKPPLTYDELLSRTEKYVNLEDAQRQRRHEGTSVSRSGNKSGVKVEGKVEVGRKRVAEEPSRCKGSYPYVPLSMSLEKMMQVCEERQVLARPRNAERGPRLPPSNKFCDFHQEYGHFINDCLRLGEEVQIIISEDARLRAELTRRTNPPRQGRAPQWRNQGNEVRGNQPDHQRRAPRNGQEDRVEQIANHPHMGVINMISGGTTNGHSGRARKAHGRSLTITNYDVARIFVDTGSSLNIIFKETLEQMKLEGFELDPITTELYEFTGHALQPLGQIVLPLSLGNGVQRVTNMACFTVVDAPFSFNGILGRPSLSDFRAVTSIYHQKLKFPSGREVGVVRHDQKAARLCYVNEVKIDAKKKMREVGMVSVGRALRAFGQKVLLMSKEGHEKVELSPGSQIVKLAADLNPSMNQSLGDCLKKNKDVFAWSVSELTGVSEEIMVHRLNTLAGVRPIKQKNIHFGPEKDKVIKKEVDELLKTRHIREVQFPTWLSNVVLVPKSSGKVMPFGLKNAGATYQRLMDRVFASQTGRNVEVYVDDILVKSQDDVGLMADLEESFSTLRAYRVKLNPEKCVFGVRGGKFLGYMLSEYDIQYEPRSAIKAQALADFLAETRHMEAEDLWKVYVDDSSNSEGCGVGVFLISPRGDEIRLAVRLEFRASNNEAEYEALLIGLRAAKQVAAARVHL